MKKTRLTTDYSISFVLFGLTSVVREYKLAWSINQSLGIRLLKQPDLTINFIDERKLVISYYLHRSEYGYFRLLKNRSYEGDAAYLAPEIKNFDYLTIVHDESESLRPDDICAKLSANPFVDFAARIDVDKLKSRDNLIFE